MVTDLVKVPEMKNTEHRIVGAHHQRCELKYTKNDLNSRAVTWQSGQEIDFAAHNNQGWFSSGKQIREDGGTGRHAKETSWQKMCSEDRKC